MFFLTFKTSFVVYPVCTGHLHLFSSSLSNLFRPHQKHTDCPSTTKLLTLSCRCAYGGDVWYRPTVQTVIERYHQCSLFISYLKAVVKNFFTHHLVLGDKLDLHYATYLQPFSYHLIPDMDHNHLS